MFGVIVVGCPTVHNTRGPMPLRFAAFENQGEPPNS